MSRLLGYMVNVLPYITSKQISEDQLEDPAYEIITKK